MVLNDTNTNSILEEVLLSENLNAAYLAVKANDGGPGVDGMTIERTNEHLREHRESIKANLLSGRYKPAAVKAVEIPKPAGGIRTLGIPTVTDRILQQAILQVLTPHFDGDFSDSSYGFRPKRSAHDAVNAAREFVKEGKHWVVDIDLKSFFDQVDHDRLMTFVGKKIRDKRLLKLIGSFLRAPMRRRDGSQHPRKKGTPQGGPLSPMLANVYLDPLDKELEKRGLSFVRYADDIAIFASSQRSAERNLESVIRWLKKTLGLEVNREKSGSGPSSDSALLGFRLYENGSVGISPKAITKLKGKVRECWEARQNKTSKQLRDQWRHYIVGWWHYFELADRRWEVNDLSGWIRRHIRKCFWLRWHNPKGRRKALQRLGIRGRTLGMASCRRGAWVMARHISIQQALKTKVLNDHGLTVPWEIAKAVK
jgi:group II intron reverse transcriptase/maturase